jgi:phosphonate transport system substrate-binding protein
MSCRGYLRLLASLGVLLIGVLGCQPRTPVTAADSGAPELRLGFTPSEEGEGDREEAHQALADYLGRNLGLRVVLVRSANYGAAIEAMREGRVDVMSLGPFAYVLAAKRGIAEALVVTGTREKGSRTYESVLLTHERTGLLTIDDIVRRAHTLRLRLVDPASNSGNLVPRAALRAAGADLLQAFGSVEFTLSHGVAILDVAAGRAEVAGVSGSILERLWVRQRVSRDGLRVVWKSDLLPAAPLAVRSGLPAERKEALRRALVELADADPVAHARVMRPHGDPDLRFLPAEDTLWEPLRRLDQPPVPSGGK